MRHTPDDGLPPRDVFLNGRLIQDVVLADERKGKVVVLRRPLRLDKYGKRVLRRTLHGTVVVKTKES